MTIRRIGSGKRMSQAVVHNGTIYLAGQVAFNAPAASAAEQTKDILAAIDKLLTEAGSDKSKLLSAVIWLADMRDYDAMNSVWDAWVAPGHAPARACVEGRLAFPKYTVEIMVTAAL